MANEKITVTVDREPADMPKTNRDDRVETVIEIARRVQAEYDAKRVVRLDPDLVFAAAFQVQFPGFNIFN